jgi:hypothetical protein
MFCDQTSRSVLVLSYTNLITTASIALPQTITLSSGPMTSSITQSTPTTPTIANPSSSSQPSIGTTNSNLSGADIGGIIAGVSIGAMVVLVSLSYLLRSYQKLQERINSSNAQDGKRPGRSNGATTDEMPDAAPHLNALNGQRDAAITGEMETSQYVLAWDSSNPSDPSFKSQNPTPYAAPSTKYIACTPNTIHKDVYELSSDSPTTRHVPSSTVFPSTAPTAPGEPFTQTPYRDATVQLSVGNSSLEGGYTRPTGPKQFRMPASGNSDGWMNAEDALNGYYGNPRGHGITGV